MSGFDARRVLRLVLIDLRQIRRAMLAWPLAILAISALVTWLIGVRQQVADVHVVIFDALFCISAAWVCTGCFREFSNKPDKQAWLALPASTLERLAGKFIMVVPLYLVALYAGYGLVAAAVNSAFAMLGVTTLADFNPLGPAALTLLPVFLAVHGILVVGAVRFDRLALPKTLLVLALVGLVAAGLVMAVAHLVFPEHFSGWRLVSKIRLDTRGSFILGELIPVTAKALFYWVLPIGSWIAAGRMLARKEL